MDAPECHPHLILQISSRPLNVQSFSWFSVEAGSMPLRTCNVCHITDHCHTDTCMHLLSLIATADIKGLLTLTQSSFRVAVQAASS